MATAFTYVPGYFDGWGLTDGMRMSRWNRYEQTAFPWKKKSTGSMPAFIPGQARELIGYAVPWHQNMVDRLSGLLPSRENKLPDDKFGWKEALVAFHRLYLHAPNTGRCLIVYDRAEERYIARWGTERSVQAGENQELLLHSHNVRSVGLPSQRDLNNSPVWSPTIAEKLMKKTSRAKWKLPAHYVFSKTGDSFEISAYWRIRDADRTEESILHQSWGDQVGLVIFSRWTRSTLELISSDTGLLFQLHGHDRAWIPLSHLFMALRDQEQTVVAIMLYGREAPDVAKEDGVHHVTDDGGDDVVQRVRPLKIGYRKRGFPLPKEMKVPYITIHTGRDTLAVEPQRLFAESFSWKKIVHDGFWRNIFHLAGTELAYDD